MSMDAETPNKYMGRRPTIAELEVILKEKDVEIEISPNGEVFVKNTPCPSCALFCDKEKMVKVIGEVYRRFGVNGVVATPSDVADALIAYSKE